MLCLSGFELYPRWVPLINRVRNSGVRLYYKPHIDIEDVERAIH